MLVGSLRYGVAFGQDADCGQVVFLELVGQMAEPPAEQHHVSGGEGEREFLRRLVLVILGIRAWLQRVFGKGSEITIGMFWRGWGDCRSGSFLATAGGVIKSPSDFYTRNAPKCRESKGLCQMFGDNAMIRISGD